MITRFRVEAEHNTRDDVIEEMVGAVTKMIGILDQPEGEWECTQDVTVKTDVGYRGRMVMKFNLDMEDEDEA